MCSIQLNWIIPGPYQRTHPMVLSSCRRMHPSQLNGFPVQSTSFDQAGKYSNTSGPVATSPYLESQSAQYHRHSALEEAELLLPRSVIELSEPQWTRMKRLAGRTGWLNRCRHGMLHARLLMAPVCMDQLTRRHFRMLQSESFRHIIGTE